MAEPTLTAAFLELQADVGFFLGYPRDPTKWNARQADDVAYVLRAGMRQFYHCGYDWSFLKPVANLTLHQAASVLALPDDYAAADGPLMLSVDGQSSFYAPLAVGPWQAVYQKEKEMPGTTGLPVVACEEVTKGTTGEKGQRMQLHFWPAADRDYTVTFAMRVNADALTGVLPYAYGGSQHSQTLLASCRAAAERDIDGVGAGDPRAVHQPAFAQMLEESKTLDRRSKPHTVGVMRDRSDWGRRRQPGTTPRPLLPIVVQGVVYD